MRGSEDALRLFLLTFEGVAGLPCGESGLERPAERKVAQPKKCDDAVTASGSKRPDILKDENADLQEKAGLKIGSECWKMIRPRLNTYGRTINALLRPLKGDDMARRSCSRGHFSCINYSSGLTQDELVHAV